MTLSPASHPSLLGSNLRPVHVRFVLDKVSLGSGFFRVFLFPLSIPVHICSVLRAFAILLLLIVGHYNMSRWGCLPLVQRYYHYTYTVHTVINKNIICW